MGSKVLLSFFIAVALALSVFLAGVCATRANHLHQARQEVEVVVQTRTTRALREKGALGGAKGQVPWNRNLLYEEDYEEDYEVSHDYEPWDEQGEDPNDGGSVGGEEDYDDDDYGEGADLGFDDEEGEGEGDQGQDDYEEDFGDYYDDGNEDTEFFGSDSEGDGNREGGKGTRGGDGDEAEELEDEGEWDEDDAFGFENGDESFTSFCVSAISPEIKDDVSGGVCDILVSGLDDNISQTHLKVDGVYKPVSCMNGYLKYSPAEGEDARMIAFDVDFEEWGFYNSTEVAQENLILHGSSFLARVPHEVEAWYCDRKVCETDAVNEHFWTPITTATISCITQEEEDRRVVMMGERKNKIIFPDEESRRKGEMQHDHSEMDGLRGGDDRAGGGSSGVLNTFTVLAGFILVGVPVYIYKKQSKMMQAGKIPRATKVRFAN
ncbi:hypothetical protein HOP50_07g49000 [Chloropicon primus]|nr:hypothetical protein HOP50_07g49000 [Chloropicon primus]